MQNITTGKKNDTKNLIIIISITLISFIIWQIPLVGRYIIYPFTIMGTWFHEMGHGLTAVILGGSFKELMLKPDGSGIAMHSGSHFLGGLGRALVAAGGPLGPPVVGTFLLMLSKNRKASAITLLILGLVMILSIVLWIREIFGILAVSILAILIIYISSRNKTDLQVFTIQIIGVEAFFSVYESIGYLFSRGGVISSTSFTSDTEVIADNLFLPHWFWAIVILGISGYLYFISLRAVYNPGHKK